MQAIFFRRVLPALGTMLLCSSALAQGGGFVFDEPAPPVETPKVAPDKVTKPSQSADDLADFTFGGISTPADAPQLSDEEQALWQTAEGGAGADAFRRYLEAYPDGAFAADARARLADLQAAEDRRQSLITACDRMAGDPADPNLSDGAEGVTIEAMDADAALWTCSRARAAAPELARISFNMGRIAEAQGQTDTALTSYRAAMQQAIAQTGAPDLAAAAGILRLSEPRDAAESMAHVLLQFSIDSGARITALQGRIAELDEALAVATADAAAATAAVAEKNAEIEMLTARTMELSNALSTASADDGGAGALAALTAQVEQLRAANAALILQLAAARSSD